MTLPKKDDRDYDLGIDLGPASIGWGIVAIEDDRAVELLGAGVRRFDAGVSGDDGKIERGADKSRATARREARGPRRLAWRRQYRLKKVYRRLQRLGLLPSGEKADYDTRHRLINDLDKEIRDHYGIGKKDSRQQLVPYLLRRDALDDEKKMPPYHLGRALYHLAQRRGFKSNLKAQEKDEGDDGKADSPGEVKKGIKRLDHQIQEADAETLGEYFTTVDPENQKRIRGRWTARRMYEEEFHAIWQSQIPGHPGLSLTDDDRDDLFETIFYQRPLKSQKHLLGRCDLEPRKRRAPTACLEFQEFRLLQRVNDLAVIPPDNVERPLSTDERSKLLDHLQREPKITFGGMRTLFKFKKSKEYGRNFAFNFESEGEKELIGNRTAARLLPVLGTTWDEWPVEPQGAFVDEILSFESEDHLKRRLMGGWHLDETTAQAVADTVLELEQGYGSHSRRAMRRLLPLLREGISYSTARKEIYGDALMQRKPVERLPALNKCDLTRELRNPAVSRTLSELRKVVNALLRHFGKPPRRIHVELARDLKHSRKRRISMSQRRDRNKKFRDDAGAAIVKEKGQAFDTDRNRLKVRLAEECNFTCPFTDQQFNMDDLVSGESPIDVEHIIPLSRSLDNSFANKTLCFHEENRNVKRGCTPSEAYSSTDKWEGILQRVKRFQGPFAAEKLRRFEMEKPIDGDEFAHRMLNDTQFMSRAAADYLSLLYGGRTDEEGTLRVQVSPGRATAFLRRYWDLESILGDTEEKNRDDHRHHAVDAVVIAMTGPGDVAQLCRAAEEAEELGSHRLFAPIDPPWPTLRVDVQRTIEKIIVSSRASRKLNGPLHGGTVYSPPIVHAGTNGEEKQQHHIRKPLVKLTPKDVSEIVDDTIRELVAKQLKRIGGSPKTAFADVNNHPYMTTKDGRIIPIHKVRIIWKKRPFAIGKGSKKRYVMSAKNSNHHVAIHVDFDKHGNVNRWSGDVVSRLEVLQRRRKRPPQPVIIEESTENRKFKFSLARGEHVCMCYDGEEEQVFRVKSISEGDIEFCLHSDASGSTLRGDKNARPYRCGPDGLRKRGARKVTVDPIGNVLPAND